MTATSSVLTIERDGHQGTLWLDNPDRRNAMGPTFWADLPVMMAELAAEIAANSPLVVQGTKAVLRAGEGRSVAEGLDYVGIWNAAFLQSNDLVEAMTAFAEKRAPHFTGE